MQDFLIKDVPGKGKGLFAKKPFAKNEILFKFNGEKITREQIVANNIPSNIVAGYLQINNDLFLNIEQDASVFVNHSCNPNTYVKIKYDTAFLLSYIPIKEGQEIVFDYSTTSTDSLEDWSTSCKCSKFGCRKIISGFQYLSEKQKQQYMAAGIVPDFVWK
jgi:uncharacterized protein